jgi:hypothetical protein
MRKVNRRWLLLVASLLAAAGQCVGQASLVGLVRDPSGAAVPEATVTAIHLQTGLRQTRQTSVEGLYSLPALPVGQYRLEVEKTGFQRYVREGITLAVNDIVNIDVVLKLGATAETVTVSAAAPLLETQVGGIRGLVDQQRIVDLPLNGRNITQLMSIQAGVILRASSYGEGDAFVVSGSRQSGVYWLMDSGMNTDSYRNFSGNFPNPDAIQEFSVQKTNFSAEYGNAMGAVVNVVTKSGTNEFHGSAFEFVRNAVFNARNFFAARRDTLKRNQFGATLGGPIRKDKAFFFASYQGTRLRSDPGLTRQFLPTAAMRRGDFSSLTRAITDPQSRQPFPGNQIPGNRLNPVTLNFLRYLPDPGTPTGERFVGIPVKNNLNEFMVRGDFYLGNHRFVGRYFRNKLTRPFGGNVNDLASMYAADAGLSRQPYMQLTLNDVYTISPQWLNSFTFAYRGRRTFNDWSAVKLPINFRDAGVKGIAVKDPASVYINVSGAFLARPGWNYDKQDYDLHWANTTTWMQGAHELKFGAEIVRSSNKIRNHFRTMGLFNFTGAISGNAMADFMLGEVYQFDQGGGEYKDLYGTRWGFFVQDNWRYTPNLTLNLGLRWEPMFPYRDTLGRVQCFVPGVRSERFPNAPLGYLNAGDPGCPEGGFDSYLWQLAPRFGFAWRPGGGRNVIRGGVGLFWNPQFTVLYNGFVNAAPFSPQITRYNVRFEDPYAGTENPFPAGFAPFLPPKDSRFVTPLGSFGSFAGDFRPSYQQMANLTLEREILANLVVRASYVGNFGRHLSISNDVNHARYAPGASTANIQQRRPFRDFTRVFVTSAESNSSYHGFQLSVERRVSENFSFELNYTVSKSIDECSADQTPQNPSQNVPLNRALNRGLSDFDLPQRLVISHVWSLPGLSQQRAWLRGLVGGWQFTGITTIRSGFPFSVTSGVDRALSGNNMDFADLVGNPYLDPNRPRSELIARYFNTGAFTLNTIGTFGTAPRNLLRGPGAVNFDFGFMKSFALAEGWRLQFRTELFNAFNKPNFGNPYAVANVTARFGRIESASDPRIMQFALKLLF